MYEATKVLLGIGLSIGALGASAAQGAVTIIGSSYARACYEAAEFDRAPQPSLQLCNQAFEEAMSLHDRTATFVNRGIVYMRMGALDRAISDYDAALQLKPDLAEAYVNKGIALLHQGDDKGAVAALDRALTLEPSRPEIAYYTRGIAHELLGDVRAAYQDYSRAAELKPEWSEPKEQLSRFTVRKAG